MVEGSEPAAPEASAMEATVESAPTEATATKTAATEAATMETTSSMEAASATTAVAHLNDQIVRREFGRAGRCRADQRSSLRLSCRGRERHESRDREKT